MIEKDPKTGLWRHPQPITKEQCDELLTQYVNMGQNPNRLRAVSV